MRRRVLLGVSWLLATVVSTMVAWQAVALVGDQVTGTERAGVTVGVTTPTTPASTDTTQPPDPGPAPAGATQAFNLVGGSVGLRCEGTTIALQWATPAGGYTVSVEDGGPDEVDVRFEAEERESRIKADCESGSLAVEPREED